MKPLPIIGLAAILIVSAGYVILHGRSSGLFGSGSTDSAQGNRWQKVDRSAEGFTLEIPAESKQAQVPTYDQGGAVEPANMILANSDAETTFSIAWADDPPVARDNGSAPERVLDAAEQGALTRTQTIATRSASGTAQGFPERDFTASNAGGGVMDARLIYAGDRLYMLVAAFPSARARRDQNVARFFNSFKLLPTTPVNRSSAAGSAASN